MTRTAFHIGRRTWKAGGKSAIMPFCSISPDYNFEGNVASIAIIPVNATADPVDQPDLTTRWKLRRQPSLREETLVFD